MPERLGAEPYLRLRYFCSSHHQDSALSLFVEQLGRAAGFARDDPPTAKLLKLEAVLARAEPSSEDVALLADLPALPGSAPHPLPKLSAQRNKERTLETLVRQLEGLAVRQPVMTVFEDEHWIDPTSRELLDLTIARLRTLPVLLIVTFRPEFQPPWAGQPQVTMLTLNRLDRRDRMALVEQIAGGKALPDEVLHLSRQRNDSAMLVLGHLSAGRTLFFAGRFGLSRSHLEEVLALYDPISRRSLVYQAGIQPCTPILGIVPLCLGYPDQTLAQANAAIAEARRLTHLRSLAASLSWGTIVLALVGDEAALDEQEGELIALTTEQGLPLYIAGATVHQAGSWLRMERWRKGYPFCAAV